MVVVAVCGTPGTGKSLVIQKVTKSSPSPVTAINVSDLVKKERLYQEYDDDLDACVMDSRQVRRRLTEIISNASNNDLYLIETHSPSILPKQLIDHLVVLQCDTSTLYDRLTDRGYTPLKRQENVEAEIMQVVLEDVCQRFPKKKIRTFPNNEKEEMKKILRFIRRLNA